MKDVNNLYIVLGIITLFAFIVCVLMALILGPPKINGSWIAIMRKSTHEKRMAEMEAFFKQAARNAIAKSANAKITELNKLRIENTALQNEVAKWQKIASMNARTAAPAAPAFSDAELRTLLQLVHPDKHGGKESAVRMTQKLNQMRG